MNISIYARISLDRDNTELGVTNQLDACRAYAEEHGWTIAHEYVDNDLSATSGQRRPEFEHLLDSKPEAILCWHTDRLIRLTRDLEHVIDLGVNVHAVQAGHLDLSTPAGRAVARTITAWATYEGEQKAVRQRLAHEARARSGTPTWSTPPLGLRSDGTLHPVEAPLVRRIYIDYVNGAPMKRIATTLNGEGVTTRRGSKWTAAAIKQLLTTHSHTGLATDKGEVVGEGDWERVIERDLWERVQVELATRHVNTRGGRPIATDTLGGGIVHCAQCRHPMTTARDKRGTYIYVCRGKCTTRPVELVDRVIRAGVEQLLARPDYAHKFLEATHGPQEPQKGPTLTDLRERQEQAATAYGEGHITLPQLTAITRTLTQQEQTILTTPQNKKSPTLQAILKTENTLEAWGQLTHTQQRETTAALLWVALPTGKKGHAFNEHSIIIRPAGTPWTNDVPPHCPPEAMNANTPPPRTR